jgi:predicted RND superfamily exporter protein
MLLATAAFGVAAFTTSSFIVVAAAIGGLLVIATFNWLMAVATLLSAIANIFKAQDNEQGCLS